MAAERQTVSLTVTLLFFSGMLNRQRWEKNLPELGNSEFTASADGFFAPLAKASSPSLTPFPFCRFSAGCWLNLNEGSLAADHTCIINTASLFLCVAKINRFAVMPVNNCVSMANINIGNIASRGYIGLWPCCIVACGYTNCSSILLPLCRWLNQLFDQNASGLKICIFLKLTWSINLLAPRLISTHARNANSKHWDLPSDFATEPVFGESGAERTSSKSLSSFSACWTYCCAPSIHSSSGCSLSSFCIHLCKENAELVKAYVTHTGKHYSVISMAKIIFH